MSIRFDCASPRLQVCGQTVPYFVLSFECLYFSLSLEIFKFVILVNSLYDKYQIKTGAHFSASFTLCNSSFHKKGYIRVFLELRF